MLKWALTAVVVWAIVSFQEFPGISVAMAGIAKLPFMISIVVLPIFTALGIFADSVVL